MRNKEELKDEIHKEIDACMLNIAHEYGIDIIVMSNAMNEEKANLALEDLVESIATYILEMRGVTIC